VLWSVRTLHGEPGPGGGGASLAGGGALEPGIVTRVRARDVQRGLAGAVLNPATRHAICCRARIAFRNHATLLMAYSHHT
jgi:hypothetical protein